LDWVTSGRGVNTTGAFKDEIWTMKKYESRFKIIYTVPSPLQSAAPPPAFDDASSDNSNPTITTMPTTTTTPPKSTLWLRDVWLLTSSHKLAILPYTTLATLVLLGPRVQVLVSALKTLFASASVGPAGWKEGGMKRNTRQECRTVKPLIWSMSAVGQPPLSSGFSGPSGIHSKCEERVGAVQDQGGVIVRIAGMDTEEVREFIAVNVLNGLEGIIESRDLFSNRI
jgi:hypothetical protein